mmetsp:Transcript_3500/g.7459  ORF Transcript_3500/g.7459 Transcript_3500/m.7459 type:complete len:215 (+) Transcript_3500:3049-3693(+)
MFSTRRRGKPRATSNSIATTPTAKVPRPSRQKRWKARPTPSTYTTIRVMVTLRRRRQSSRSTSPGRKRRPSTYPRHRTLARTYPCATGTSSLSTLVPMAKRASKSATRLSKSRRSLRALARHTSLESWQSAYRSSRTLHCSRAFICTESTTTTCMPCSAACGDHDGNALFLDHCSSRSSSLPRQLCELQGGDDLAGGRCVYDQCCCRSCKLCSK